MLLGTWTKIYIVAVDSGSLVAGSGGCGHGGKLLMMVAAAHDRLGARARVGVVIAVWRLLADPRWVGAVSLWEWGWCFLL